MKIRYSFGIIPILSGIVFLTLSGCVKNDLEEMEAREKKIIDTYLVDNNISPDSKTEGGIYFIEKTIGTGLSPVKDNFIVISYVGKYLEDGSIRETSYDSLKADWPIAPNLDYYLYGPVKLIYGYSMPGINEALSLMKEGSKATAIIPSDKANYDYKPLIYEIELIRVIRDPIRFEDSVINVYAGKYFGDTARIDTLGIWTRVDEAPVSANVFESGDTLYFNFNARLIDGFGDSVISNRIFDSNTDEEPVRYLYGQSKLQTGVMLYQNTLPKGLRMAIDSLTVTNGMKFSVLLKYDQAFGAAGLIHPIDKYIIIPVFQTVQYDIEITAIKPE